MNPFGIIGLAVDLAGVALLVAGILLTGEARAPLVVTGVSLSFVGTVMVVIGQKAGRFYGRSPRLAARGIPATARVEQMEGTGVIFNGSPVVRFTLQVTHEARDYPVRVQQAVPRRLLGVVLPGSRLAVRVDPARTDRVVVDWSQAPLPPRVPPASAGDEPGTSTRGGGPLPEQPGAVAELLARGRRGTARIVAAQELGEPVQPGVVAPGDEPAGAMLALLDLEVKLPGREAYPVRVVHRVPSSQVGRAGPGREVVVAVDRDDPGRRVVIDWETPPV